MATSSQSYLPLFRKYRPQSFKDVIGQDGLVRALSNAIELNRIANAYLFCGPRGTGKTSTARIFAKSLNCVNGPTLEPCQKCASCVDITNASGLDVIEIDAASNRGIQDAKELISQVQYAPINGKYKIFIIDEVHMLSNDAFNALLKTFEEPPQNVIFILATTEPHKVLETIVSRCQRFDLRRITIDDIVKRLRQISDLENIKITDDALFTIAKNVSGGLRDSLALLDQVSILGAKEEIQKELIEELLGKINFDVLFDLFQNIINQNIENTIKTIDKIYLNGNEPRNLCENFIEFLRNIILILNSSDVENLKKITYLAESSIKKVKESNFDKDFVMKILDILIEYYKEIKISTNPYLWMELAAIAACNPKEKAVIKETKATQPVTFQQVHPPQSTQAPVGDMKPANIPIQPEINTEPQKTTPEPIQKPSEAKPVSLSSNAGDIWVQILGAITSTPTRAFYSGIAKLVSIENNKITLGFSKDNLLLKAKTESNITKLQKAIDETANGYSVDFIKIDDSTKIIEVEKPKPKIQQTYQPQRENASSYEQKPIENKIENNSKTNEEDKKETSKTERKHYSPEVQDMIEQFNGRIVE